jgi:hypothetical protein
MNNAISSIYQRLIKRPLLNTARTLLFVSTAVLAPLHSASASDYNYYGIFIDSPFASGDRYNAHNHDFDSFGAGFIAGRSLFSAASVELRLGSLSDFDIGSGTNVPFVNSNFFTEASLLIYPTQGENSLSLNGRQLISPFLRAGSARVETANQDTSEARNYLSLGLGVDIGGKHLPFDLRSELHFLHDDYMSATTSVYFKFN